MHLFETVQHLFSPRRSNNFRPRFLHPKPLLLLSVIAIGFYQSIGLFATLSSSSGVILGYASNITAEAVVSATNTTRAAQGLTQLKHSASLSQAAATKAADMFANGYWAHTSPTGQEPWDFIKRAGYSYRVAGENLARDFDSTSPMMSAWMNSPTHRANIVNPRYQEIGVAVINGQMHGVETTLVVQMFATPAQAAVAQPAVPPSGVTVEETDSAQKTEASEVSEQKIALPAGNLAQEGDRRETVEQSNVLAEASVPAGQLEAGILYSPKLLLRAFLLAILFLVLAVLVYDAFLVGHRNTVRLVGKNLAHIMVVLSVIYLVVVFKTGVIGL